MVEELSIEHALTGWGLTGERSSPRREDTRSASGSASRRVDSSTRLERPGASRALFVTFFALYLLGAGRFPPNADARSLWEVAENLVTRQSVAVQTKWNVAVPSPDGKVYCLLPLFGSLVHVPGAALREAVGKVAPKSRELTLPLAAKLGSAAVAAFTLVLFFGLARRHASPRAALATTVIVGLGTLVAYYARMPYTEILQACCFTGFVSAVDAALREPDARAARRLGLWLGLLVNAKLVFLLVVPGVALVFAWELRPRPRTLWRLFAWAAAVAALCAIPILWYNRVRFGSPFATGYGAAGGGVFWRGAWGLLFSPGKSVFLYDPPLLLALAGIPAFLRRSRPLALALAAAIAPVFAVYAQFIYWDGDWAWGPRYLVPFLPACCLPLALVVDRAMHAARRHLRAAVVWITFAAGTGMQILGGLFFWDHWISISIGASSTWLGTPACDGGLPPEGGCWPEGKFLYGVHWLPSFNPIAGHAWLLRHKAAGDRFEDAQDDAPWQFEGHIDAPGAKLHYNTTTWDWWALAWGKQRRAAGVVIGVLLVGVLFGATRLALYYRNSPTPSR